MTKGLTLLAVLFLTACLVDDQTIVKPEDRLTADPTPTQRDFVANNANHKVLLAVIDTGVDYNQPLLKNNMHFKLDETGNPVGFGYDYIGNDGWASPYVVRTSRYYDLPAYVKGEWSEEKYKRAMEDEFAARYVEQSLKDMIQAQPSLARFFEPQRNIAQEIESDAFHGTHVAGLMTYDRPDFGLLAYRVLPSNDLSIVAVFLVAETMMKS
jgi:subtilisin family serine protease